MELIEHNERNTARKNFKKPVLSMNNKGLITISAELTEIMQLDGDLYYRVKFFQDKSDKKQWYISPTNDVDGFDGRAGKQEHSKRASFKVNCKGFINKFLDSLEQSFGTKTSFSFKVSKTPVIGKDNIKLYAIITASC